MFEHLSDRPHLESLQTFVAAVTQQRPDVVSLVLFGSMAKGNFTAHSDYDVLVVIRGPDPRRVFDRNADFGSLADGWVEPQIYTMDEVRRMFADHHLTILEALHHGITLRDDGFWADLQRRFETLLTRGRLRPRPYGWQIVREAT